MVSPTKMIVVSHTHWDREWYLGFQRRRVRLVEMMDALLDLLARRPRFTSFTLDGQTVPLEDYLEVRPERRAEIRERVRQERLLIGPWYTSPDEFLVSAEALIRNLMLGHRIAAEFGEPMKAGYLPDSFGQMAQMPQILRGFGISSAVFWRGVGDEPGKSEFRWRAPDGSTVLAVHLPEGYGNAADLPGERKALVERMATLQSELSRYATTDHLLLMDGGDHHWPQEDLPQVLALANEALEGVDLVQGTLQMYIEAIEKANPPLPMIEGELRCAKNAYLLPGTLSSRMPLKQRNAAIQTLLERWAEPFAAWAWMLGHPYPHSLLWQAWKYLLQNHAHDSICGATIDAVQRDMELRFAWAEEIGEEIVKRSLRTIAGHIDTTALSGGSIPIAVFNPLSVPHSDVVTVSFQPLISLEEGKFAVLDSDGHIVPHEMVSGKPLEVFSAEASREEFAGFVQMIEGGEVFDLHITSLDFSPLRANTMKVTATLVKKEMAPEVDFEAMKRHVQAVLEDETWQRFSVKAYFAPEVKLSFLAKDIPGCGYKTYQVTRNEGQVTSSPIPLPSSPLTHSPYGIENEFYVVVADATDGTLTITDKETGIVYHGCNRFVDEGEAGDLYWHEPPARDVVVDRPAELPQVTTEQRALGATLHIEMDYSLPAELTEDRGARSEQRVSCPISSHISLRPVGRIDIRTEVENQALNHRLRVHFPTPIETERSCAEGAFGAVERPVGIPSGEGWVERPVGTHPQASFVVASDGTKGLMVINRGLPEYEFLPGKGGVTVALTLLRCVDRLSRGAEMLTPLAQCPGRQVFEYALLPYGGDWQKATLYHEAHAFNAPLRTLVTHPLAARDGGMSCSQESERMRQVTNFHKGGLPVELSFASMEPADLVVSAVKLAEAGDGLILRLYNPTSQELEGKVGLHWPFAQAHLVRLDEEEIEPLARQPDGRVMVQVGQNEAITIKFSFEEER